MALDINVGSSGDLETKLRRAHWNLADMVVLSRTTLITSLTLPLNGDIYIVPDEELTNPTQIIFGSEDTWSYLEPAEGWLVYVVDDGEFVYFDGAAWATLASLVATAPEASVFELEVAVSDETTSLTTGTAKVTFYAPMDATITEVFTGLTGQSSSGVVTADLNKNGTTMFTTPPSIDASENTSLTGTVAVLSVTTWTKGDKMTVDIDAAGTSAEGLKMVIRGTRT